MNFKELKKKKESELHNLLAESRDKLRELRFKDANKQLKTVNKISELKKVIAKILTILNEKKKVVNGLSNKVVETKDSK
ncbi:50S ribosomal protein L29 [Candidatus Parcubacteria bacterium]|nr:50S ribosomal protein L29 [Candidatus Parcubacteria bacterium]